MTDKTRHIRRSLNAMRDRAEGLPTWPQALLRRPTQMAPVHSSSQHAGAPIREPRGNRWRPVH